MAIKSAEPIAAATSSGDYLTKTFTAKDGMTISYRQIGHGPGLVMLHGSMESSASHMALARELADAYTVYLPDRRGHSLPGAFRQNYNMQKEVDDLEVLMTNTGTRDVFGVSSGGLIALQAALKLPTIRKVIVYEPALVVNHSMSMDFIPRYDREVIEGRTSSALVTAMLGGQLGPEFMNKMPRWFLKLVTTMSMRGEDKKAKAGDVTMRMLAPTIHYDFALVSEMAESLNTFKAIKPDVLLLGGSASPAWLKLALNELEKVVPHVKRIEFPGFNHGSSSDLSTTNRDSHPAEIAAEMRRFLSE